MNIFAYWFLKQSYTNGFIECDLFNSLIDNLAKSEIDSQIDFHTNFKDNFKIIRLDFQRFLLPDNSSTSENSNRKTTKKQKHKSKSALVTVSDRTDASVTDPAPVIDPLDFVQKAIVAAAIPDRDFIHILNDRGVIRIPNDTDTDTDTDCLVPTDSIYVQDSDADVSEELHTDPPPILIGELIEDSYDNYTHPLPVSEIDDLSNAIQGLVLDNPSSSGGSDDNSKIKRNRLKDNRLRLGKVLDSQQGDISAKFSNWFFENFKIHDSPAFVDKSFHISLLRKEFIQLFGVSITVNQCSLAVSDVIGLRDKSNRKSSRGVFASDGKLFVQGFFRF